MRKVILAMLAITSVLASAEEFADRVTLIDSQLNKVGAAIVCTTISRTDDVSSVTTELNSILAAIKTRFAVSAPSLQNSGYRSPALCVTLTKMN